MTPDTVRRYEIVSAYIHDQTDGELGADESGDP